MTGNDVVNEELLGKYHVDAVLKDGASIRTLQGHDGSRDDRVIIKVATVSTLASSARLRLEHEAAVLRSIRSNRIVPLLDFGSDGEMVCLVTPFVEGVTLEERLKGGALSLQETLTLAQQLLESLRDAHDHGVLHRDVKPSNIIVEATGPISRVTLIDFGLARTEWLDPSIRDIPAGTVRYMSPEQAGLLERSVDERSDLYSAGAVLYECLAGRPLFPGTNLGEVLRQHLAPIASLRDLDSAAPTAVDALVARLLSADPDERYQSAEAVLADLADIVAAIERGEADPQIVIGARDRRRTLAEASFVGRNDEMRVLMEQVERASKGEGQTVLVEAESGGGKSRLLEEFAMRLAKRGVAVYRGRGVDQTAQRPFEVLNGVASDLLAQTRSNPCLADPIRERLSDRFDALCHALPDLEGVFGRSSGERSEGDRSEMEGPGALPEAFAETRTIDAIAELLDAMGSGIMPAVVLLDDCQWADELTLKLLIHWQRKATAARRRTLVVAAFRSEEVDTVHPLRRVEGATHLELPPLGAEEVVSLAESMAGHLPTEATDVIVRLSEGSPFMASAVLRGLVESRALVQQSDGWRADRQALADVRASRRAAAFLVQRLRLLPEASIHLLSVGAVLGKEFDPDLAASLAEQDPVKAFAALDEARKRHIVWIRSNRCVFVHDKLRESLLGMLEQHERRSLHRLAALRIREVAPDRILDLAFHFDAAGESALALSYALEAAERAREQHALDAAQQQFEIAERGVSSEDHATRLAIAEGLGDVLMLRGFYDEAASRYEASRSLTRDRLTLARIEGKIGEVAFKRGDVETASVALERALRSLGRFVPKRKITYVMAGLWEVIVQLVHMAAPKIFLGRKSRDGSDEEFIAIRLYSRLAHSYWFARGTMPTLWTHLRELNLAERYPPSLELAQAYSEQGPAVTLIPWYSRGVRYVQRSLDIRKQLGDVWGQGQSLHFLGLVLYANSRFEECIERCREAVRLLEHTGDRWEVNTANWHIAFSLYRLGDLRGAAEMARRVYQAGVEIGDAQARGISLGVWAKSSNGRVPPELVRAELEQTNYDVHTGAEVLKAEALRHLAEGRTEEAVALLEQARKKVKEKGLRQEYVAPVWPWLATARRTLAEESSALDPRRRRKLIRKAARSSRQAVRLSYLYKNNLAHSLREAALVAAMRGREGKAHHLISASIAAARRFEMEHEQALSMQARGRIGVQYGWRRAAKELETANEILAAAAVEIQAETVTPSLVDRFDSILEVGRTIASALSSDAIYSAVRASAITLLRGERCLVLEAPDGAGGDLIAVAGHAGEFSRTIARIALERGKPVVADEASATDASESVVLSGIRSALCAPIHVRGKAIACMYVEHRRIGGLFGEDEERLAGFISAIAGAALENAEGFAQIRELTSSLEIRVEERTAELSNAYERERDITAQLRGLDQFKTELMAIAAHDIRTPMTVIAGFVSTLRDHWDRLSDADKRNFFDRVAANTKRLGELVENLLQFGRIESGELSYDREEFDFGVLVQKTVAEQVSAGITSQFIVQIDPAAHHAFGDQQRYWQVLTNLIVNAVKFSPASTPIEVEVLRVGEMLEVSVRDYGMGIAPEAQGKLFQKFNRVEQAPGEKRAVGTGLGLYICKSIVEQQGGRIGVASVPGEGSRFSFTVPIASAKDTSLRHATDIDEEIATT